MVSIIAFIIGILLLVLQYYMLSHFILKSNMPIESKKGWILAFVFLGWIAAIIYYFSIYKNDKDQN